MSFKIRREGLKGDASAGGGKTIGVGAIASLSFLSHSLEGETRFDGQGQNVQSSSSSYSKSSLVIVDGPNSIIP